MLLKAGCYCSMGHDAKPRDMRVPDLTPRQTRQSRKGRLPCRTLPTFVIPGITIQVVQWIVTKEANLPDEVDNLCDHPDFLKAGNQGVGLPYFHVYIPLFIYYI